MAKALYIAEKPSVAREFAKALKLDLKKYDGYINRQDEEGVFATEIMLPLEAF